MFKNFIQSLKNNFSKTINDFKNVFSKNNLILGSIFIIVGLIIHLELIIREVANPDTINSEYYHFSGSWECSLGRWFLVALSKLRFGLSTPLFSTFFSIFFMVTSALFIINLFDIKKTINKSILILFLISMPAFSRVLTYHYCSLDYNLSMLLSVLAPWCLLKINNKYIGITLSSISVTLSMGIYQSYIGVTFGLYFIYIIYSLFIAKKNVYKIKDILQDILKFIFTLIIGFTLYAMCSKLFLIYFDVGVASFRGANNINIRTSIMNFPQSFSNSYKYFFNVFFTNKLIKNSFYNREILNTIVFIFIAFIIFLKNLKQKKYKELIIQFMIFLLLPMAFNVILFIATETYMSRIMTHGMFMIFVLLIVLIDKIEIKLINFICTTLILFLISTYIISANASYASWTLTKNQTLSIASKILYNIEENESYNENSKICIVGCITDKNFPKTNFIYNMTIEHAASSGFFWNDSPYDFAKVNWSSIYETYFGYNINLCSYDEYKNIISSKEFKDMKKFPNNGYIKNINDIIVVKLNNN